MKTPAENWTNNLCYSPESWTNNLCYSPQLLRRITHVLSTNFTVSSEFTFGDSLILFFLLMNNQPTRRADKRNPTVLTHLGKVNPTV